MKSLSPYRTTVASFSASKPRPSEAGSEYDAGEYILALASLHDAGPSTVDVSDGGLAAAALSDHSVAIYDASEGRVVRTIGGAHGGPISGLEFVPGAADGQQPSRRHRVVSSSRDGTCRVWDAATGSPVATLRLDREGESALCLSVGYGGALCAVGTDGARVSFFDLRPGGDGTPSGSLMGSYVDAHTEGVNAVRFGEVSDPRDPSTTRTVLASAGEDGLAVIHDPSAPGEEEALVSVLNAGAPLRRVDFFGPSMEGLCCLTGNETASVHAWDAAQTVSDLGGAGLRRALSDAADAASGAVGRAGSDGGGGGGEMSVEYLVGCTWTSLPPGGDRALHLLGGNSRGDGYLFRVDADRITPALHLRGGHAGCIRDFCWIAAPDGGRRLVTGGEDARICEWDTEGGAAAAPASSALGPGGGRRGERQRAGGKAGGRSFIRDGLGGGGASKSKKGKHGKKVGSPY